MGWMPSSEDSVEPRTHCLSYHSEYRWCKMCSWTDRWYSPTGDYQVFPCGSKSLHSALSEKSEGIVQPYSWRDQPAAALPFLTPSLMQVFVKQVLQNGIISPQWNLKIRRLWSKESEPLLFLDIHPVRRADGKAQTVLRESRKYGPMPVAQFLCQKNSGKSSRVGIPLHKATK